MLMCKYKPNLFSRSYYEYRQNKDAFDNYVLLPKIDDNGNINSCYLLINILPSICGV